MTDKQLSRWAHLGTTDVLLYGRWWDIRGADSVSVDHKKRAVHVATPWSSPKIHQKIENVYRSSQGRTSRPTWG